MSPSPVLPLPAAARGLRLEKTPLLPASLGGDGNPEGSYQAQAAAELGPDAPEEPDVTFSYYRLVGTAFNPRTSTTTFDYGFDGCVYETGGTDNRFMAPLLVPDGSVLKYLRFIYDDTSAGSDLTAWITRYQPGVTSEDLTSVMSAGSSGYGNLLSPEITHTVDLVNWAYTVVIAPNAQCLIQCLLWHTRCVLRAFICRRGAARCHEIRSAEHDDDQDTVIEDTNLPP